MEKFYQEQGISNIGNTYHTAILEGNNCDSAFAYALFTGSSKTLVKKFLGAIPGLSSFEASTFEEYLEAVGRGAVSSQLPKLMDAIYQEKTLGKTLPTSKEEWKNLLKV